MGEYNYSIYSKNGMNIFVKIVNVFILNEYGIWLIY